MASPFNGLAAALLGSVMATPVTYLPAGGSPIATRALMSKRDPETEYGGRRSQREIMQIEVAREVVLRPARGDRFLIGDRLYQVSEDPAQALSDPEGLFWLISGYEVEA